MRIGDSILHPITSISRGEMWRVCHSRRLFERSAILRGRCEVSALMLPPIAFARAQEPARSGDSAARRAIRSADENRAERGFLEADEPTAVRRSRPRAAFRPAPQRRVLGRRKSVCGGRRCATGDRPRAGRSVRARRPWRAGERLSWAERRLLPLMRAEFGFAAARARRSRDRPRPARTRSSASRIFPFDPCGERLAQLLVGAGAAFLLLTLAGDGRSLVERMRGATPRQEISR
jgi:hypothetical protein